MLRLVCAAAATVAVGLAVTPLALAHQGNPSFRSEVMGLRPSVDGLQVQVVNYDDSLEMQNRSNQSVVVEGYRGEPYVRISADGTVAVNHRSPSFYLNDDRYAQGVTVPANATPTATPDWQTVDRTGRYTWHDHRIHWMARSLPPQVKDESRRTKVFDWKVPLEVGARQATITGSLRWVGKPGGGFPIAAGVSLAAVALAGLVLVGVARRRRRPTAGAAGAPKEAW